MGPQKGSITNEGVNRLRPPLGGGAKDEGGTGEEFHLLPEECTAHRIYRGVGFLEKAIPRVVRLGPTKGQLRGCKQNRQGTTRER